MDLSATKELQKSNYKRPKIKDFNKDRTKDFKKRRRLNKLYSNNNNLKTVYI